MEPDALLGALERRGARLVLGDEAVYELAKTFTSKGPNGLAMARGLFSYLKVFLARSIPVAKDNMALVASEMQALQWMMSEIYPYINASDYEVVRKLIEHLSHGEISEEEQCRTDKRMAMRDRDRSGLIQHFAAYQDIKQAFLNVSKEEFPQWLRREEMSASATIYLANQIHEYFSEQPLADILEYAYGLRYTGPSRVAKAMIRRNIYLNWRCAHRESVSKDLFPDSTHVINANYCDIYATKEPGQAEYAALLLTSATSVRIYDRQTPVQAWLISQT